jgi:hypothetical protein
MVTVLAVLVFIAGLAHTARELNRHLPFWFARNEVTQLLDAYDRIWSTTPQIGNWQPRGLSLFGVHEYLRPKWPTSSPMSGTASSSISQQNLVT